MHSLIVLVASEMKIQRPLGSSAPLTRLAADVLRVTRGSSSASIHVGGHGAFVVYHDKSKCHMEDARSVQSACYNKLSAAVSRASGLG